ncbi:MAG: 16S rRNA (guanine(527)-N(7))-methyltransferase RsmG [Clostridiaceae bacterium]|nr:16S rRNA (guanine(527)-N(7))-methyltransferase RsmG [Clostridiaceae bacterium]
MSAEFSATLDAELPATLDAEFSVTSNAEFSAKLSQALHSAELPLPLSEEQLRQLQIYGELLNEWQDKMNLTAITDPERIVLLHFVDSLELAPLIRTERERWRTADIPFSLADVGTGAGFPGLVLQICEPVDRLLLIESVRKKTQFLRAVVERLELPGVEIDARRAEEIGRDPACRARYTAVTARAVASLPVLCEYCLPLLREGGVFWAMKGRDPEIDSAHRALRELGGKIEACLPSTLSDGSQRHLVVIRKHRPTPARYPRRVGIPSKNPL